MASDSWPPASGLFTPSVARSDVILSIHGRTEVDAPAATVLAVLRDTANYSSWNTFVPDVDIHSQPDGSASTELQVGTSLTFQCVMDPAKPKSRSPTQLRVMDVSTPEAKSDYVPAEMLADPVFCEDLDRVYRISWKVEGGYVSRGLRSERFHEIIVLDERRCEVRNWETMGGILARTVKWVYGRTLPLRCNEWLDGLKQESEKRAAAAAAETEAGSGSEPGAGAGEGAEN